MGRQSATLADGAAKPPCAAFGGHKQVNPAQRFPDNPVAGGHCQEKEAGNGTNLFQTPVANMTLKATGTAGAVSPQNYAGYCQQYDCSQQAKRAEIGRQIVNIESCAAHGVILSG